MSLLSRIFGKDEPKVVPPTAPVEQRPALPEQPIFVIGDLHGRVDLLERMLERIDQEIGQLHLEDPQLIFTGNILDRGPDSAKVLLRMMELTTEFPQNVISLMGNHEQMCLDFLTAPAARYARWLRDGGDETCRSFGVNPPGPDADASAAQDLAEQLKGAFGARLASWIAARPVHTKSGNLHVVHAGADPVRPMDDQAGRVMIWGHPEFLSVERGDGQWVAHGHYAVERPEVKAGRIAVNTSAWETGILSAAMILPLGEIEFLQVTA